MPSVSPVLAVIGSSMESFFGGDAGRGGFTLATDAAGGRGRSGAGAEPAGRKRLLLWVAVDGSLESSWVNKKRRCLGLIGAGLLSFLDNRGNSYLEVS